MGGSAGIEAAYLEMLQTQTGKSPVPFPETTEAERSPRHPRPEEISEEAMAPHSSTLAWKIHGQRSLVGCSPWGR